MKYKSTITGIGEMALDFISEDFIIIFNDNAPAELAEISVLHSIEEPKGDLEVGDKLMICGKEFEITAVGEEAIKTFRELGHCTIKFTGSSQVELPGHIEVKGEGIPEIKVGDKIEIF